MLWFVPAFSVAAARARLRRGATSKQAADAAISTPSSNVVLTFKVLVWGGATIGAIWLLDLMVSR